MNNYEVFEQIQNMSSMYLASNKKLQCNTNCGIDIRNIRLFEVTNQTYDTVSKNLYAIENILDAMQYQNVTYLYLIQGTGSMIHYYYGLAPILHKKKKMSDLQCEIEHGEEALVANFEANFPGSNIIELTREEKNILHGELLRQQSCAVIEGVPGVINSNSTTLGMDRFINVMEHESFLVLVLAQPLCENEIKEIVSDQQNMLNTLTPLLEYSKVNHQSHMNEISSLVDKNRVNTRSQTNTSTEQLQFQLFSSSGLFPLKLGRGSLQEIEDLFFNNGVANNELIDLIGSLCIQQQNKLVKKTQEVIEDTSPHKEEAVTIKEIGSQEPSNYKDFRRKTNFGLPWMRRNHHGTKTNNRTPEIVNPRLDDRITENNVEAVGDNIMRYLQNSESEDQHQRTHRETEDKKEKVNNNEVISNEVITNEVNDVEELAADFLSGQNEFTLASINRLVSRANARVKSCSTNNRILVNNRDTCTNTCSVTERYINTAVSSWNRYINEIMNSRLLYGENRGLYICSTTVFAGNEMNLTRAVAAWRGMNEYDTVSKVPLRETILYKDMNQYNNIVNFQIPKYFYCSNNNISPLSYQEVIARSAYSQFSVGNYMYGGNWLSSKELKYMVTLPMKSACTPIVSRKPELSITSVNDSMFPDLDRKKMRHGCIIIGERYSGREETLKNILLKFERPFTLLEFDSGRYSRMFKGKQRVERYPLLMCAGKILKINPFELYPEELIDNHVELLLAYFIHCYGFEPLIIEIIEKAIYDSYVTFGWNLYTNTNDKFGKLAYTKEVKAFPTFFNILVKTEEIIKKQINDCELQLKCLARVRDALNGWTIGKKGALLGAEHSMNLTALLEQNTSIELEELVNEADRKFFTLLYMWRCMAMRKSQGIMDYISNHVIVLEDIGRILNKGTGERTAWEENAVETIIEYILSSMKYGESIVLIEEEVSSLPKNIKTEVYSVFLHQIISSKERDVIGQWLNIGKEKMELVAQLDEREFLCITRDNQEIYEYRQ
ncbi:hypothetical protein [Anaerosporobacter sp.]